MATQTKDYYETLGLKKTATADEIRKAFRKLARKHHPDVNPGDKTSEERFKTISEANDVLSDPKKRKVFDQLGFYSDNIDPATAEAYARAGGGAGSGFPGGYGPSGQGTPVDFGGFDFSDLFEQAQQAQSARGGRQSKRGSGGFRDIFSNMFTGGRGTAAASEPVAGTDLEYQVNISFWDAIRGTELSLSVQHQESCANCHGQGVLQGVGTCPECSGKGQVTQVGGNMKFNLQCPRCNGTGKAQNQCSICHAQGTVSRAEALTVRIKPGTRNGQRIRLAGKGNAGQFGGTSGDLYIVVRVGSHPVFLREGDDIFVTIPVTMTEAALGAKIEVPTIDGRALLKIPPGTQSGQKLRLREKGVPSVSQEGVRGDEIVEMKITVPMPRDEQTKELLRKLAELNPDDPRDELWKQV